MDSGRIISLLSFGVIQTKVRAVNDRPYIVIMVVSQTVGAIIDRPRFFMDGTRFFQPNRLLLLHPILQNLLQELAGIAVFNLGYFFGRSRSYDRAAAVSSFGAHVDDVVGGFDDV